VEVGVGGGEVVYGVLVGEGVDFDAELGEEF